MKLSKLLILTLLTSCFSGVAATSARANGSYYDWNGAYCYEYSSNGDAIHSVNPDTCRTYHPTHFDWNGSYCYEYNPNGDVVQSVNANTCRTYHPTHFDWNGSYCYEYNPNGDAVQSVNTDTCRTYHPTHYSWNGSYCYEYNPHGDAVQSVSRDLCRYSMNEDFNGIVKHSGSQERAVDASQAVAEFEGAKATSTPALIDFGRESSSSSSQNRID